MAIDKMQELMAMMKGRDTSNVPSQQSKQLPPGVAVGGARQLARMPKGSMPQDTNRPIGAIRKQPGGPEGRPPPQTVTRPPPMPASSGATAGGMGTMNAGMGGRPPSTLNPAMMKKGGAIKKMASGGSASKRADGIAQRGKTRA